MLLLDAYKTPWGPGRVRALRVQEPSLELLGPAVELPLPGPQRYIRQWPKPSLKSPTDHVA